MRSSIPRGGVGLALATASAAGVLVSCVASPRPASPVGSVVFDTAVAWVYHDGDSTDLLVEIAATQAQMEVGLSGRASLDPGSGMWFRFDALRSVEDGFWMWDTRFGLDIAFLDPGGVILEILGMAPCAADATEDDCPGHFPSQPYASALEAPIGWFAVRGITVGDRVIIRSNERALVQRGRIPLEERSAWP